MQQIVEVQEMLFHWVIIVTTEIGGFEGSQEHLSL